jgi:hypothetical protein
MHTRFSAIPLLAALAVAAPAGAQNRQTEANAFEWGGQVAAGRRLHLFNTNGNINIEASTGRNLEVVASKSWQRGNPADVRVEAVRLNSGDVAICAIWNDPQARCTETGVEQTNRRFRGLHNDTQVSFTVRLPAGVHVNANTTNGSLTIAAVSGEVRAHTTNGNVSAESIDGAIVAGTTNGDIRLRMSKLPAEGASYRTTNGSITVELPAGINANIEARTTNGSISSDFEMMVTGSISPRSLRGRIGSGGPTLSFSTTNGNVRIRRQ